MLCEAERHGALSELLSLTAVLSIQDPRERPAGMRSQADETHRLFADQRSDFSALLNLRQAWRAVREAKGTSAARRWCREHFLSAARMREWDELRGQLAQIATEMGWRENEQPAAFEAVHRALLTGLLSGIGERTERGDYLGARGLRFAIARGTPLAVRPPRWIMAATLVEMQRVHARLVAAIEPGWIEAASRHLLRRSYDEPEWSPERGFVAARETVVLYGLTLSAGRRINYGRVEPAAARRIFVREALVAGRSRLNARFLTHNRNVRAALERDEAKLRRHAALFDEDRAADFYFDRIPVAVHDLNSFERWRRDAESIDPDCLLQQPADVIADGAQAPDPAAFPDKLSIADRACAVSYRFEPGADDDGATIEVPLALLPLLPPGLVAWGLPGTRLELVTTLIRGLPKAIRRPLVPAPSAAQRALEEVDTTQDMWGELGRVLSRHAGNPIAPRELQAVPLPEFLRLNLRVIGDDGRMIAEGRDAESLRAALRGERQAALRESTRELTRTGLRRWDFGRIAETVEIERGGVRIAVHPALSDDGGSVSLIAVEDEVEALATHRRGLRRLLALALNEPLKPVRMALAHDREFVLLQQPIGPLTRLIDDVCDRTVARACLDPGGQLPRDLESFERALERGRGEVYGLGVAIGGRAKAAMLAARAIRGALADMPAGVDAMTLADCHAALAVLAGPRFVMTAPDPWFDQLPRLLAGLHARVLRLREGRNPSSQRELAAWRVRLSRLPDRRLAAEMEWLLAEYCVSLFAQQLGTSVPVSAQRLEQRLAASHG
jgi:ATP-dependent helicase HrpA